MICGSKACRISTLRVVLQEVCILNIWFIFHLSVLSSLLTDYHGHVVGTPDSYFGGLGFKARFGVWLS